MFFGNFVDRDGHFVDTVHFPPVARQYRFRGKGVYSITGKVMEEFDCITIEVLKMERLATIPDPRYSNDPPMQKGEKITNNLRKTIRRKTAVL
jgi:DNA polymerase-3 subunit alpha